MRLRDESVPRTLHELLQVNEAFLPAGFERVPNPARETRQSALSISVEFAPCPARPLLAYSWAEIRSVAIAVGLRDQAVALQSHIALKRYKAFFPCRIALMPRPTR